MLAYAVTKEWTSMLRPWMSPADIDGRGRLTIAARSRANPAALTSSPA